MTAVAVLVAGCGGGERLSKAAYQDQLNAVGEEFVQTAEDVFMAPELQDPRSLREAADKIREGAGVIADAADDLDAINPPEAAEAGHDLLVEGLREFAQDLEGFADDAEDGDIEAIEEFSARVSDESLPSIQKINDALQELDSEGFLGGAEDEVSETPSLQEEAQAAAQSADCSGVTHPPSLGTSHEPPYEYGGQVPAASGPHDPAPMPADVHVYEQPQPEPRLIHNLEHGYMLVYYRTDGDRALPQDVVEALEGFAQDNAKTIMAPYPNLPEGTDLAFVGWTTLQECPSQNSDGQAMTSDDALTLAGAFRTVAGDQAPEPAVS